MSSKKVNVDEIVAQLRSNYGLTYRRVSGELPWGDQTQAQKKEMLDRIIKSAVHMVLEQQGNAESGASKPEELKALTWKRRDVANVIQASFKGYPDGVRNELASGISDDLSRESDFATTMGKAVEQRIKTEAQHRLAKRGLRGGE